MQENFALFTDASLDPKHHLGVGACLLLPPGLLEQPTVHIDTSAAAGLLRLKRFEQTTSTALEVRTALWGLEEFRAGRPQAGQGRLRLYCDAQCISGLLERRAALEAKGHVSGISGRQLKNAPLYRAFYSLHDQLGFDIVRVSGHTRAAGRDMVQQIFSCVDREARKALRCWVRERRSTDDKGIRQEK